MNLRSIASDQNLLFSSVLLIPFSMTLSGLILIFLLLKTLRDELPSGLVPPYLSRLWYLFLITSLVQGIFTVKPLLHYAGLIGHYLIYWLIFLLTGKIIRTRTDTFRLLKIISLAGLILALIGILAYAGMLMEIRYFYISEYREYLVNLSTVYYQDRARGFYMHPNIFGAIVMLTLIITVGVNQLTPLPPLLQIEGEREGPKPNNPVGNGLEPFRGGQGDLGNSKGINRVKPLCRGVLYTPYFIQFLAIFLSKSRGAILSSLFSLMLLQAGNRRNRKFLLLITGSLVLVILFNYQTAIKLFSSLTDFNYHSNSSRIAVWEISLDIIRSFPFGIGILNYEQIYPFYLVNKAEYLPHAHNWYLQTLIESGVIAGTIFLLFFLSLVLHLYRNLGPELRFIPVSLTGLVIFSLSDYVLSDTRLCVFLTLIIFSGFSLAGKKNLSH